MAKNQKKHCLLINSRCDLTIGVGREYGENPAQNPEKLSRVRESLIRKE